MTAQQFFSTSKNMRTWVNDGTPIPDWAQTYIVDKAAPNGTFLISTPVGNARVHAGNVIIEYGGELWTRTFNEVPQFIEGLKDEAATTVASIGPGKSAQFGTKRKSSHGTKHSTKRKTTFRPPIGPMPSIEWVHTSELTVDYSYQRTIDNEGSRRLITSIAANFDWRLCVPLVVSRRMDGTKVIIDGQHRWAAAVRRGEPPVPIARECRMIRHLAIQAELAKPSVREIQMDLLTQPAFRTNAHAVADDQHADHQFRINRRTANRAVEWRQLRTQRGEIEKPGDPAQHVIRRYVTLQPEVVKQLRCCLLSAHHRFALH